jgi:hypothetical protein
MQRWWAFTKALCHVFNDVAQSRVQTHQKHLEAHAESFAPNVVQTAATSVLQLAIANFGLS